MISKSPTFFGEIRLAQNAYHSFYEYISSCGPCHETDETNIAQFQINMGNISMKRFGCKQAAYRSSIWDACVWLLLLGPPPTEIWLSSKRKLYLLALYLLLVLLVYSKIWNGKPVSQNEKKTQLNYQQQCTLFGSQTLMYNFINCQTYFLCSNYLSWIICPITIFIKTIKYLAMVKWVI